jgi:hypothetical protein
MRILYAAAKCDYGDESTGASRQHPTLAHSFVNSGEQPSLNAIVVRADDRRRHYEQSTRVVCVHNAMDHMDKVRYYVDHHQERRRITETARLRALTDHMYEDRFSDTLARISRKTTLEAPKW